MAGGINPPTPNQTPNPRKYEQEIARGFGSTSSGFSAVHCGSAQSPILAVRFRSGSVHRFRFGSATSLKSGFLVPSRELKRDLVEALRQRVAEPPPVVDVLKDFGMDGTCGRLRRLPRKGDRKRPGVRFFVWPFLRGRLASAYSVPTPCPPFCGDINTLAWRLRRCISCECLLRRRQELLLVLGKLMLPCD